MPPRPIVTLLTDFGLADPYVAAMKGVLLSLNPDAIVVDIGHEVRPQRVEQGAFILEQVIGHFPPWTVHVAVVDPGVGTERRALALQTPRAFFVGPDNGLLSPALPARLRSQAADGPCPVPLPPEYRAVSIENQRYFRHPVSSTFHGRDIFAPAAAYLSLGTCIDALGPPVDSVLALPPFRARRLPDGTLVGRIVHIDRFGNLITSIHREDLPGPRLALEVGGRQVAGLVRTYAEAEGLCALIGSAGHLEIALPMGSAARALDVDIGAEVLARPL